MEKSFSQLFFIVFQLFIVFLTLITLAVIIEWHFSRDKNSHYIPSTLETPNQFLFEIALLSIYQDKEQVVSGEISAPCNLRLSGSRDSPASLSWVARITGVCHHTQLIFVFLVETGFHYVGQNGLDLLTSRSTHFSLPKCWDHKREPPGLTRFTYIF